MANIYVRSTDGSDADNGSTWALAKATLLGAAAIDAPGDRIYVSQAHAESSAAAQVIGFGGTTAAPVWVVGSNDAAEPPTALSTTPTLTTTGNTGFNIQNTAYIYGLDFKAGTGATGTSANIIMAPAGSHQYYQNCTFELLTTSVSPLIQAPASAAGHSHSKLSWKDCSVKFSNASQAIGVGRGTLTWDGGGLVSGGTSPTNLVKFEGSSNSLSVANFSNLDLSNCSAGVNLFTGAIGGNSWIRNSKLPASWSGALFNGTPTAGQRVSMYNCDAGDTNYRMQIVTYAGNITSETVIVRTGGASDGTTPLSWKMVTGADAEYPLILLESDEIVQWNETTGSSLTATIEIIHDSQGAGSGSKFQDDEIWLEVMYLGTSGFPLGTWITDCKADVLAAAANQTDSSETWTTTGLTTPVKQKLSVTFTAQEKGFIHARVVMATASKTAYICPKLAVT